MDDLCPDTRWREEVSRAHVKHYFTYYRVIFLSEKSHLRNA
jgi:hypothetical protein